VGSRRVTIEIPDDVYERLVAASRAAGSSLDATIVSLVTPSLPNGVDSTLPGETPDGLDEFHRAQAALRERLRQGLDTSDLRRRRFDPESAAEFRGRMPVLDPPLSQTIIEGREDRV
jgi:hypothetical protein